jgi:hypothetical protein
MPQSPLATKFISKVYVVARNEIISLFIGIISTYGLIETQTFAGVVERETLRSCY